MDYPGAWHHVMNRGRRREKIFQDGKDHQAFVKLLRDASEMFRVRVAAFCLMPNHYHLLLQTPEANLTRCMRHVGGVYTQHYNREHGHDGQLFRGRYKALLVDLDEYLLGLVRYIHRNPLKAGLVEALEAYPWSSHPGYLAPHDDAWSWLHTEPVLMKFGDDPAEAVHGYRRFMEVDADDQGIERIFGRKKLPAVLGGRDFVQSIKDRFFSQKLHSEVPAAKILAPSAEEVLSAVRTVYGAGKKELYRSTRGVTNEPRNVAVYLIRTQRGERLNEIADRFRMRNYSTASSAVANVKRRLDQDPTFRERVESIKALLSKSQNGM